MTFTPIIQSLHHLMFSLPLEMETTTGSKVNDYHLWHETHLKKVLHDKVNHFLPVLNNPALHQWWSILQPFQVLFPAMNYAIWPWSRTAFTNTWLIQMETAYHSLFMNSGIDILCGCLYNQYCNSLVGGHCITRCEA